MEKQKISRAHLKELYDMKGVCTHYKSKIEEYLKKDLFSTSIEISQDDINSAFSAADSSQKKSMLKFFKKEESIMDKISGWKDVLKELGITEDSLNLIKNARSAEDKAANALKKIFCITKVYNKGWIPNWKNSNEYKYFPYLYFSDGRWSVCCLYCYYYVVCPSGVYFKDEPSALDAIWKFRDIYDDYFMVKQ